MEDEANAFVRLVKGLFNMLDVPVVLFREKIVEPNQKKYPWYHQKFRRVPTIDECHEHDYACYFEANCQFLRDKLVDEEIVNILRQRYEHCCVENINDKEICRDLLEPYHAATTAFFIKYGDLGIKCDVVQAFMKQKHRMVWERRHGPVGSGMKETWTV
ncbi:NADH dehydrogenase (ubiquinone) PDSW subunit [Calliopsis andreniformis]|uniref:NADH dehydrogenase (ubiquinone) PDSW subunit n=1 Tax=Calliopsis andreniformis TaxID=337506 RepID=UPI003FCDD59D